jgi:hypothetical protein
LSKTTKNCKAEPFFASGTVFTTFLAVVMRKLSLLSVANFPGGKNQMKIVLKIRYGVSLPGFTLYWDFFSNLSSCLSVDDFGGPASLHQTWTSLGSLCLQSQDPKVYLPLISMAEKELFFR